MINIPDYMEQERILTKITREIPGFNEDQLLEFTKDVIPTIHYMLSNNQVEKCKKYCKKEVLTKIMENKEKYRISNNFDFVKIGYARLQDCVSQDDECNILVYASINFYDDISNNEGEEHDIYEECDKYWNDIWLIKFRKNTVRHQLNKCPSCGSSMEYDNFNKMFTCEFCRNSIYYSPINWEVVDIELVH